VTLIRVCFLPITGTGLHEQPIHIASAATHEIGRWHHLHIACALHSTLKAGDAALLQFLTSWQVLLVVNSILMAIAFAD
jgi:hypothetical protein